MKDTYNYFIRFSAEIGTKNTKTRWNFIRILGDNIRAGVLHELGIKVPKDDIDVLWDHIELCTQDEITCLDKISGISSYSRFYNYTFTSVEQALDDAYAFFEGRVKGKRYAVRCKRVNNPEVKRMEIEGLLGERLLPLGSVDLTNPEITCHIDFRNNSVYMYDEKIPGMHGLPMGTQGRTLTMLSGGIDSPVAAWLTYRVGIDQDFVYYDLGGSDQKLAILKICKVIKSKWGAGSKGKLIIIDFNDIIQEIFKAKQSYHNLILKYFFYKTAEKLASSGRYHALVTGESIGQVSTQTLQNLAALDRVTELMIIRPLATYTKEEIIRLARDIDTFEMAYKGKEYCALAVKNVATAVKFENLIAEIEPLDKRLIDQAIEAKVIMDPVQIDISDNIENESDDAKIPDGREIIDLRSAQEYKEFSLDNSSNIPFQSAWAEYIHWEKDKAYFLVCNEGSMSAMLANYMEKDGFEVSHLSGGIKKLKKEIESTT